DLDAAGLAEDETNKLFAIRCYEQGDFTANAEHPMVMKMLCFASMQVASFWNHTAGGRLRLTVSDETALRLPNATFGALTVVPLFLFTSALFGFRYGLIAALLWALGLNSVWINRVVKEDTLLVFFMFTGFYFYNRAKERPASDKAGEEKYYALSGAAFGLMLASKYFPHYYGLNALFYHLAGYDSRNNRPISRRARLKHFAAIMLAFVVFNPATFSPQAWRYIKGFMSADLVTHHGYLVGDDMYLTAFSNSPDVNLWYFYFLFLAVKLPLPLLLAFLVGVVEIFRHRGDARVARGYLFLRMMLICWFVPMTLVGSKFLRYTLSLMPLVYMTAAVGIIVMWRLLSAALKQAQFNELPARRIAAVAVGAAFLIAPAVITIRSLPHPSLYLNAFGGNRVGYFFPHDEFYDLGARESIRYIAEHAPPGATIASEIPGVVQYYLERYDRTDIQSRIISHPKFDFSKDRPDFVLLQRGRVYFENRDLFQRIESRYPLAQASVYQGAAATQVYATGEPGAYESSSTIK
ncbi:MAG TPA: glycosyltransferase family 39 protein, partial [Blastocatellia bacterium]|nr:glycosyltransferase family 39 protein [Blastocatellia bacterium]